jgi:hypothetical protein
MDRPVFVAPGAELGPGTLKHIRPWVAPFDALLVSGRVILAILHLRN